MLQNKESLTFKMKVCLLLPFLSDRPHEECLLLNVGLYCPYCASKMQVSGKHQRVAVARLVLVRHGKLQKVAKNNRLWVDECLAV